MPILKSEPVPEARGWYSHTRHAAGAEVGVTSLELAAERLMEVVLAESPSDDQFQNALAGYVEVSESAHSISESLARIQMMLRITGQKLMEHL